MYTPQSYSFSSLRALLHTTCGIRSRVNQTGFPCADDDAAAGADAALPLRTAAAAVSSTAAAAGASLGSGSVATGAFAFYASNFADYNATYGSGSVRSWR